MILRARAQGPRRATGLHVLLDCLGKLVESSPSLPVASLSRHTHSIYYRPIIAHKSSYAHTVRHICTCTCACTVAHAHALVHSLSSSKATWGGNTLRRSWGAGATKLSDALCFNLGNPKHNLTIQIPNFQCVSYKEYSHFLLCITLCHRDWFLHPVIIIYYRKSQRKMRSLNTVWSMDTIILIF